MAQSEFLKQIFKTLKLIDDDIKVLEGQQDISPYLIARAETLKAWAIYLNRGAGSSYVEPGTWQITQ